MTPMKRKWRGGRREPRTQARRRPRKLVRHGQKVKRRINPVVQNPPPSGNATRDATSRQSENARLWRRAPGEAKYLVNLNNISILSNVTQFFRESCGNFFWAELLIRHRPRRLSLALARVRSASRSFETRSSRRNRSQLIGLDGSIRTCLPDRRWRRNSPIRATICWGVGRLRRRGREERSAKPAPPCPAWRAIHLRSARGHTPAARAAACGLCPLATCMTTSSRPIGVKRAFLGTFIRSSSWPLKLRNSSLHDPDRVDNLSKPHT